MLRVRVSVMQRSTRDSIGSLFNSGRFSRIRFIACMLTILGYSINSTIVSIHAIKVLPTEIRDTT